jgi:hypothetical protein
MSCPRCTLSQDERRICIDVISPYEKSIDIHSVKGLKTYLRSTETDYHTLRAAFINSKLWSPASLLVVGFIATSAEEIAHPESWAWKRAYVAYICQTYVEPYANLTFQYQLDPSQQANCTIRISFNAANGSYSRIGTDSLQNWGGINETMNLGWMDAPYNHTFTFNGVSYTTPSGFDQGGYPGQGTTIIHEFGHILGMIHEHQTPFSNPITWNTSLVYQIFGGPPNNWTQAEINSNIINVYSSVGMNGSNFDGYSIMKYYFPSSLLSNPTPELAAEVSRLNLTLSHCDKLWIATNYPGKVSAEDILTYQNVCSTDTAGGMIGSSSGTQSILASILAALVVIILIYAFLCIFHRQKIIS